MSTIPEQLRYAASHEWIKVEGDTGTVGITDHAQHELSDVVYVELPKNAAQVSAGSIVAVIESVKAASDIYSPVNGTIFETNQELATKPELINQDPFGAGWLFKLKLSGVSGIEALMDATAYKAQIGE